MVLQNRYALLAGHVVLEVDPDAIDCIGFYPVQDKQSASDTLGEDVAGAAVYFKKPLPLGEDDSPDNLLEP